MTVAHTNVASGGNKWPEQRIGTLDVDLVAVTETWLRPEEGDNNLMARYYSFFIMDKTDGKIGGGTLISVAET